MRKKRLSILYVMILLFASNTSLAITRTMIYGSSYIVDTLQYSKVGPGTYFSSVKFTGETTNMVFRTFFLHVDTENNPNLQCRVELGRDSIIGGETVRAHATRKTTPGNYYIAGINGDFYATSGEVGTPINACTSNSQMATPPTSNPNFVITDALTPWCSVLNNGNMTMKINGGDPITINRVNGKRYANELVLFNSNIGNYTHTSPGGKEIVLELLEGEKWKINSPVKVKVVGKYSETGNMGIPEGQAVLSADGTAMPVIESLKDGDEIELNLIQSLITFDNTTPNITQTVGGNVFLLQDGQVVPQGDMARHPRTMMGYTKDKKQIIFCVFDGRSSISAGGIYLEMADIMKFAGADWAINVDGGGSSTMYVQNLGIMNNPSDGTERAVSNGTYLVLNAPEDNDIASISFIDYSMNFPKYGVYKPKFYGYNKYGMLIDTDVQGVELSCPAALGEIKDGNTFIGSGEGTYALSATYKGMTASIPVTVSESDNIRLRLHSVVNDCYRTYPVEVEAMMNEKMMPISPNALKWSTEDASIVEIDPNEGILKGVSDGIAKIYGTVGDFNGELEVHVEKPTARVMPIDKDMDLNTWKITQVGGADMKAVPYENGIKLTYTGKSGRGPHIKLSKGIQLWSLPDTIRIRINPGDAPIKAVTISTKANEGGIVNNMVAAPQPNEMNVIDLPTDYWCDNKDMKNFPIYLNYIQFDMGTSTTGKEYSIEIPGLEVVYAAVNKEGSVEDNILPSREIKIVPNPVKAGYNAEIKWLNSGDITISVHNSLGQEISRMNIPADNLKVQLPTSGLLPGVYIVTIIQDGISYSSKLMIVE